MLYYEGIYFNYADGVRESVGRGRSALRLSLSFPVTVMWAICSQRGSDDVVSG